MRTLSVVAALVMLGLAVERGSAAEAITLSGTLRRVAVTERELIVARSGPGDRETYTPIHVTADTIITRDGKPATLDDLKAEETVTVQFEQHDGVRTALSVRVGAAQEQAPMPRAAPVPPPVPPQEAGPAPAAPPPPEVPAGSRIAKVRRVLRLVDRVLERIDERTSPPRPPEPRPGPPQQP